MATIITKNSSTAGAAPTSGDLVQGELAVNVTDKALYTENASGTIVKLNTPSIVDNGNATAITIDSSENVGIGTSSPYFKLDVNGQARLGGSTGLTFGVGTAFAASQAEIYSTSTAPMGLGTAGSASLQFYTGSSERMRIDTSGNLLVGTASTVEASRVSVSSANCFGAQITGVGGGALNANYTAGSGTAYYGYWKYGGAVVGYITSTGSTVNYTSVSDYRLKDNIAPMTGALEKVSLLKPCTYSWKSDGADGQGFIAHELAEVVPDCVTGAKDAVETYTDEEGNEQTRPVYQGIDTSFLVATLTAAIQELAQASVEQQSMINTQQATLTSLTERIVALEAK